MAMNEDREISVDTEQMDDEDDEQMDQQGSTLLHNSAPTPVIVSVSPNVDSDSEHHSSSSRQSPSHSPSFQFTPDHSRLLSTRTHLQVRQTLSEPGRNRIHRTKLSRLSPTHLSPVQPRKHDLSKTLSMGAALDTASGPILWKPVESTGQQRISHLSTAAASPAPSPGGVESMQQEGGDDSPNSTPSISPRSLPTNATPTAIRFPLLAGQIPTQEQLEAMYKHIPSSHDQLELMQKQMIMLLEQQQKAAAVVSTSGAGGTVAPPTTAPGEMFQFPMPLLTFGLPATPLQQLQQSSTTNSSTTPSPTPSNSSTDSGIAGISAMSGLTGLPTVALPTANFTGSESLSLGAGRRPLSESLSAPGYQTPSTDNGQYEAVLKQFQLQQQHLLLQGQQMQQHYLEQQQRLIQQALLERKQFEDQQRQLAAIHLRQQQELQKKQQLLRQMQESQLVTIQRQQQVLLLHSLAQQQRASQLAQAQAVPVHPPPQSHKPAVRRLSGKSSLSTTGSNNSLHEVGGASEGIRDQLRANNHSPSLTPKASLTPTNSFESTASNNGRGSPHVGVASPSSGQETQYQGGTGLVYDTLMLKHNCSCGGSHPDHPGRLQSIWARLHETRVVINCKRLRARKASLAELQAIHSENHVRLYGRSSSQRKPGQEKKDTGRGFIQLSCGGVGVDRDTYWNEAHTSNAARMAAGSVIELADKVCSGEVKNGFAFVRPPGHHALPNQAMAFCYFNNVALAAKAMLSKNKRVAVVDWDIHHGNGTQHIFYDNPGILFISVHRYDNGTFFPGTGRPEEIGSGAGLGFNVNVAFSGAQNFQGISVSKFGDAEYLAVFRSIVIPICREFKPDVILVSAGFNATDGHPPTLGGYSVTPQCYAMMTRMLMSVGLGRVAMALEGGYELMSLCASAEACMRSLLGFDIPQMDNTTLERAPQAAAVASAEKTIAYHKNYWRCLTRSSSLLNLSHLEAEKREMEEADTVSALASLSVASDGQQRTIAMQTAV